MEALAAKRRDARLLENLERRKHAAWKLEFAKELDQQSVEAHHARWRARSGKSASGSRLGMDACIYSRLQSRDRGERLI
jgi:hypothetical protein